MSSHNICFYAEIRKTSILSGAMIIAVELFRATSCYIYFVYK